MVREVDLILLDQSKCHLVVNVDMLWLLSSAWYMSTKMEEKNPIAIS